MVYTFDVGVTTHELMKQQWLVDHYVRVELEAPNYHDASLLAIQMGFVVGYATTLLDVE